MTKVKICGLFRNEDIEYVNICKPDFAGFIIDFAKSHRSIDVQTANKLIAKLDKDIKSVCVFVDAPIEKVLECARFADCVQLHGTENADYIAAIRQKSPGTKIFKAYTVRSAEDIAIAKKSNADIVLLDNGYGTGNQFDWALVTDLGRDFFLAGGINSTNVIEAIEKFNPYGIDVSSSVETEKVKDFEKIKQIMEVLK